MEREVESQPSAVDAVAVKVLVSFYLSLAEQQVPHKLFTRKNSTFRLMKATKHMVGYTDLKQIALTKGLGQNSEVTSKKNPIDREDVFSIRYTKDLETRISWTYD